MKSKCDHLYLNYLTFGNILKTKHLHGSSVEEQFLQVHGQNCLTQRAALPLLQCRRKEICVVHTDDRCTAKCGSKHDISCWLGMCVKELGKWENSLAFSHIYQRADYLCTFLFILRREQIPKSVLPIMADPSYRGLLSTWNIAKLNSIYFINHTAKI